MPKTLEELYADLKKQEGKSPEHRQLIDAIREINEETARLRRPEENGLLPLIDEKEKKKLADMHRNIAKNAEAVIAAFDTEKELADLVKNISALASANYNTLMLYDPGTGKKTLETLEEDSRSVTLDLRNAPEAETLSGAMSQRQVLSFADGKGNVITGLFTPKNVMNSFENISNGLNKIADGMPKGEGKKLVSNLIRNARSQDYSFKNHADTKTALASYIVGQCTRGTADGSAVIHNDEIARFLSKLSGFEYSMDDIQNMVGAENLQKINTLLDKELVNTCINMDVARITNGSRIDSRNSAMSAVAGLLGVPNVVARARPMTVIDRQGNLVEGTFMTEAEGMDPRHPTKLALKVSPESMDGTSGRALKDLADLQALDYICGNVDRHDGNMFYKYDKNGKLIGVQGIDNDCAFGLAIPESGKRSKELPSPELMKVMSQSTYKKIMKLDGDTLRYSLRGFGLSEKQLDKAVERLQILQAHLKRSVEHYKKYDKNHPQQEVNGKKPPLAFDKKNPGMIRIVPDKEFNRVQSKDVVGATEKKKNTFSHAMVNCTLLRDDYRNRREEAKKLQGKVILGAENRAQSLGVKQAADQGKNMMNLLDKTSHWFRSSDKYRDVEAAAKAYTDFQKDLLKRLQTANKKSLKERPDYRCDLAAVVTDKDLKQMQELSRKLAEAGDAYLAKKLPEGKNIDDYSTYTKNRIASVRTVTEQARKNAQLTAGEQETSRINTRQAKENLIRRLGEEGRLLVQAHEGQPELAEPQAIEL